MIGSPHFKIRVLAVALALISLTGCGKSGDLSPKVSGKPLEKTEFAVNPRLLTSDPALAMVERMSLGNGLKNQVSHAIRDNPSFQALEKKLGEKQAGSLFYGELAKVLPKYQAQWNIRLARAYEKHLTSNEILSLTTESRRSPYMSKLTQVQPTVNESMKLSGAAVLEGVITDTLRQCKT